MTEEEIARMSPAELQQFEHGLRIELEKIEYEKMALAKELKVVEKDLREYHAQQAYWAAKYSRKPVRESM